MEWITIDAPTDVDRSLVPRDKGGNWQWGNGSPDERRQRQNEQLQREQQLKDLAYSAGAIAAERLKSEAATQSKIAIRTGWEAVKGNIHLTLLTVGVIGLHGGVTWLRPIVTAGTSFNPLNPLGALQLMGTTNADPTPLQKGDRIGEWIVTSGFGTRTAPTAGASTNHKGIDLNTPIGTPLYAPEDGPIECKNQPGGYGLYADAAWGQAGHLSECVSGDYQAGQQFGKTGNSGISTGPHLDLRQGQSPSFINPTKGFTERVMGIASPDPDIVLASTSEQFDSEQMAIATEIIAAARAIGANSERELKAVLMTAMQESSLRDLSGGDRDSNGILQQRPSMGWPGGGVQPQVQAFFQGAGTNPGFWELDNGGELGRVIQSVQRSAHPTEYSKWESAASEIVNGAIALEQPEPRIMELLNRSDGMI